MGLSMSTSSLACRVGSGAGFAGDRIDPAVRLVQSGEIDTIALECLAERTLVPAIKARTDNPHAGFDPRLERRMTPLLPAAHKKNCRIVSNLGAANPVAAGEAITKLSYKLGIKGQRVAALQGDDVMALQSQVKWIRPITGKLIGAHAYLGCEKISQALEEGAHVVVTGRVADSALFAAPARAHLNNLEDALAGALTVGHLLECGGQLTGGNYEPIAGANKPPPLSAQDYAQLGYPLAKVYADGTADISVLKDAPGIVDAITCTLQLLYEVHDPARYITPDLIVDFSNIKFESIGRNTIRMTGAKSKGLPPTLKVAGFVEHPGFLVDIEIGFAGEGALARALNAADVLRYRLNTWAPDTISIDVVGLNSVLGAKSKPHRGDPVELRVHISAQCETAMDAQSVEDEIYSLTLSGPAGGCSVRSEKRNRLEVLDGYIQASSVPSQLIWSQS